MVKGFLNFLPGYKSEEKTCAGKKVEDQDFCMVYNRGHNAKVAVPHNGVPIDGILDHPLHQSNVKDRDCQGEKGQLAFLRDSLPKIFPDKAEKKRNERRAEESGESEVIEGGRLWTASGLAVSYISQDTSFLRGSVKEFCKERNLDESLFLAILRQLDMERVQFEKRMQDFSEGQKKKVLLAASLLTPAHLYIWDEPLNYIDVFSRMQVEELLLTHRPTMLVVDHDVRFVRKIATKLIDIPS